MASSRGLGSARRHRSLRALAFACLAFACLTASACGARTPSEDAIYHDPALRPGVAPASDGERALLERLADAPTGSVELSGRTFVLAPAYQAASGRECREVSSGAAELPSPRARLACETEDGWVFVPNVFADTAQRPDRAEPAE